MEKNDLQMQPTKLMKFAKIGSMLLSASLCALGIIRIAMPLFPAEQFRILCGMIFIAFGCMRILGFCSKDLFRLAFQYDLEFGILLIVFGILAFIRSGNFTNLTCVLMGLLILADALFKIRITLEAKKFGVEQWWFLLMIAIFASVLGGILVFYSGKQLNLILGITLIAEGTLNFSTVWTLVKIIRHQVRE